MTPDLAFDIAHLTVQAHCDAFHGGFTSRRCSECKRLEAHEAEAAEAFAVAFVHDQDRLRFLAS